ncbi:head-tail connector protein [Sulfitobacter pacificus]|nr:head-tail connector protein [Sulfitobacter pacificus]
MSAPENTPVTEGELLSHLRLTDGEQDGTLARCVSTAIAMLDGDDGELGRALISQTWREYIRPPSNGSGVQLSLRPAQSIESVAFRDAEGAWVEADLTGFSLHVVEDAPVVFADVWPVGHGFQSLRIDYVAGYGDDGASVPDTIKQAILLLAAHYYLERAPVVSKESSAELPISIDRLLQRYKVWVR